MGGTPITEPPVRPDRAPDEILEHSSWRIIRWKTSHSGTRLARLHGMSADITHFHLKFLLACQSLAGTLVESRGTPAQPSRILVYPFIESGYQFHARDAAFSI